MNANLNTITSAATAADALRISGELGHADYIRCEYIKMVLGPRALGGYFKHTRANIKVKFITAWERANS